MTAAERQADAPVVLTGASGFLAKHIGRRLLEEGHAVRATLRDAARADEVRAAMLPGLPPEAASRLTFAAADLLRDDGWAEAMTGARALVHAASPLPVAQPRDAGDVIRPAVDGTRRALEAARAAGVLRVVLTSSVVAVRHDGPPEVQDEHDWADPDAPRATPYERSKILAERAAWELAGREGMLLTAINPGLILGPLLDATCGTSVGVVRRLLEGRDRVLRDARFSVVDVRDVAGMHVAALGRPETHGLRLVAVAGALSMPAMARALKAAYPDRRIATRAVPSWLVRAASLVVADLRRTAPLLGRDAPVSSARARALLGMTFIPAEEALLASARSLVERGLA